MRRKLIKKYTTVEEVKEKSIKQDLVESINTFYINSVNDNSIKYFVNSNKLTVISNVDFEDNPKFAMEFELK